jgi:hypothetical protein
MDYKLTGNFYADYLLIPAAVLTVLNSLLYAQWYLFDLLCLVMLVSLGVLIYFKVGSVLKTAAWGLPFGLLLVLFSDASYSIYNLTQAPSAASSSLSIGFSDPVTYAVFAIIIALIWGLSALAAALIRRFTATRNEREGFKAAVKAPRERKAKPAKRKRRARR